MFFYLSKVLWNFFNQINMLVILLFIGIIFHLLKKKNFYRKIYQITFILFILIAFLPTGTYLLWKLENTFPKPKIITNNIDGILILGSGINESMTYEHQQIILNDRIERMTESIKLMKKFPKANRAEATPSRRPPRLMSATTARTSSGCGWRHRISETTLSSARSASKK